MMNSRSDAAEIIKTALPMPEITRFYGFDPNRAGFIRCPFHTDKTGSLKVYPGRRGWHCFGCGAGSDAIDFVQRLFNLDYPGAIARLSGDFNLGISNERPDPAALARIRRAKAERERDNEKRRLRLNALCGEHRRLWGIYLDSPPALLPNGEIQWPDDWVAAASKLPYLDYLISEEQDDKSSNR